VSVAQIAPLFSITERMMFDALHRRYGFEKFGSRRYAVAEHVRSDPLPGHGVRTADFVAMDTWPSGHFELQGHEIKVSRPDWLRELADPHKAAEFTPYMHRWWVVVPDASIVKPGELPEQWGLLAFARGSMRAVKKAPRCAADPLPPNRLAALLRAVQKTAASRREVTP